VCGVWHAKRTQIKKKKTYYIKKKWGYYNKKRSIAKNETAEV